MLSHFQEAFLLDRWREIWASCHYSPSHKKYVKSQIKLLYHIEVRSPPAVTIHQSQNMVDLMKILFFSAAAVLDSNGAIFMLPSNLFKYCLFLEVV